MGKFTKDEAPFTCKVNSIVESKGWTDVQQLKQPKPFWHEQTLFTDTSLKGKADKKTGPQQANALTRAKMEDYNGHGRKAREYSQVNCSLSKWLWSG